MVALLASRRAATYTPEILDARTKDLQQPLKVPLCNCWRVHARHASSGPEKWRTLCGGWLGASSGAREAADKLAKVAEERADRRTRPVKDVLRDLVELSGMGHPWTHVQAN